MKVISRYICILIICHIFMVRYASAGNMQLLIPALEVMVPDTVEIRDQFILFFSFSEKPDYYKMEESKDFTVIFGPGVSTTVKTINGVEVKTFNLTYVLQPTRKGKLQLPKLVAEIDKRTLDVPVRYIDVIVNNDLIPSLVEVKCVNGKQTIERRIISHGK